MANRIQIPGLSREGFGEELLAGVTLLAIAVPLNIGYAQIAGLPPTAGLYALVFPTVVFALTTSSRQLVASPDAAAAALVASSLIGLGAAAGSEDYMAMAAAQALLGGLLFLLFAVFRLGFLANFLSKPILVGFVGGLALEIMLSQVAKMLGIGLEDGEFFEKLFSLLTNLNSLNAWALLISVGSVAVLLLGRRLAPAVPWALVVLIVATIATVTWQLTDRGVDVLGEVPSGPPTLAFPGLELSTWLALIPSALALTLVTVAEGLLVIRSYAEKNRYETDANQDLTAFGLANIAAGLSTSFTVGSSTSRTAAMDQVGSRTQLPSLVTALGALLLLIFGTALLADIPSPAIGAIVAVAVVGLVGVAELRELWAASRFETVIALTCMAGVLILGPISGVLVAFVLSLINFTRRAANPAIDILAGTEDPQVSLLEKAIVDETAPGVIMMRFSAPIFFANSEALGSSVRAAVGGAPNPVRSFVFDLEAANDLDVTGAEALRSSVQWLHDEGVAVAYTRLRDDMRKRLDHFGLLEGITEYLTNRQALAALRSMQ